MEIFIFALLLGLIILFIGLTFIERRYACARYEKLRTQGDRQVQHITKYIVRDITRLEALLSFDNLQSVVIQKTVTYIAQVAQHIEKRAQDVTRTMNRAAGSAPKTKSKFLKDVSIYKRNLDIEHIKRETSLASDELVSGRNKSE